MLEGGTEELREEKGRIKRQAEPKVRKERPRAKVYTDILH